MLTIVHGIVNAAKLCRTTSSLTRTNLLAINTRRPVVCGTYLSSAQHQLKASYSTTTLSSSLSLKPWHRLFPSQHNKTTTKATFILLALSRWARSSSNRTNLLYRGVPPTRGGGTYRHRTFREQYSWTERLDRIPNNFLIWGILGLNGFVFFMWQIAMTNARMGDASLYVYMSKNILLNWRNLTEGRIWTLVTSTFSHMDMPHFILNAMTFYFMAPPVLRMLGNASFLSLYFMGGLTSSTLSLLLNQHVRDRSGSSNGASGAIFAVASFFACVSPHTKFLLFFVVPLPAWAVVTGIFLWDGYSALTDRRTKIDGAGHVGGILAGAAYYLLKIRGL